MRILLTWLNHIFQTYSIDPPIGSSTSFANREFGGLWRRPSGNREDVIESQGGTAKKNMVMYIYIYTHWLHMYIYVLVYNDNNYTNDHNHDHHHNTVAMMMIISRTASGLLARQRCSAVIIQIVMIMGVYYVCIYIHIYIYIRMLII